MNKKQRILLGVGAVIALLSMQSVRAQQVSQLIWQLGVEDGGQSEFSQEGGSNEPPGDPNAQDDDFYFAGSYPDTVGVVSQREAWTNFDRALTPGNPRSRIHFVLDKATSNPTNDLKFTIAMGMLGAVEGVTPTHDLVFRFNGNEFFATNEVTGAFRLEQTMKAGIVQAVTGENVIEIERTGGTASSWIQFDFIRLEIPASDTDGDGLKDCEEITAKL